MAGVGVDQPVGRGRRGRPTSPAAHAAGHPVEVGEGGVALGVHDQMHVLGPADHPQLGHALMRRDHQLHARPAGLHQPLPAFGVAGAARPEDRLVPFRRHRTGQAERLSAAPAPAQRGLAPGRVVGQRHGRVVVAPLDDRVAVVRHRLPPIILIHATGPHLLPQATCPSATHRVATVLFAFGVFTRMKVGSKWVIS